MVANELAMSSYFLNPGGRISYAELVAASATLNSSGFPLCGTRRAFRCAELVAAIAAPRLLGSLSRAKALRNCVVTLLVTPSTLFNFFAQ